MPHQQHSTDPAPDSPPPEGGASAESIPLVVTVLRLVLPGLFRAEGGTRQTTLLLRLMRLFLPYKSKIIRANLLVVVASFLGVFSFTALIPILGVFFQDPADTVRVEGSSEALLSALEAEKEAAAARERQAKHDRKIQRMAGVPVIGSLLSRGAAKYYSLRATIKTKYDSYYHSLDNNQFKGIAIISAIFLLATLIRVGIDFMAGKLMAQAETGAFRKLSQDLYAHCLRLDLMFFHWHPTGMLMTRVFNDVGMLRQTMALIYGSTVREPANLVFYSVFLLCLDPFLTILVVICLPFLLIPMLLLARRIREISRAEVSNDGFVMDLMQASFSGIKDVKAFGAEKAEIERFEKSNRVMYDKRYRRRLIKNIAASVADASTVLGVVIVLLVGSFLIFQMEVIEPGPGFLVYLIVLTQFYKPVKVLSTLNVRMQRALMSAERVFEIQDTQPRIVEPENPKPWPEDWDAIRFDEVRFRYGSKSKHPVILQGVNTWFRRDDVTALIGRNGSGKSTMAALLCRFYIPNHGKITIGHTDIMDISSQDLRSHVALLSQEPILFDISILENIAYGADEVDEERAIAAAKMTQADAFISKLPNGYQTCAGERGGRLSGGQRQLIALSRVLYHDPEILIMDEPEAALDVKHQASFAEAMRTVTANRTVILITHKLPDVVRADKIVAVRDTMAKAVREDDITAEVLEQYV